MTTQKNLETSLVGRKCRAKYNHIWFNVSNNTDWTTPVPTDEATIVAAFYQREKDGSGGVKIVAENAEGQTMEFYIDSVVLVPEVATDPHPFFAMEDRIMKSLREKRREDYREWLRTLTPEEFEAERTRTQELLAKSPFRKGNKS
jgi:hypothetical protein